MLVLGRLMAEAAEIATAIAKEVAKQIPVKDVYEDAIQPASRQVGTLAGDIAKTIMLVLAPLQFTGALQDRFRMFLDNSIRRVPQQARVAPPPQILGPVLEGIRYEADDSAISEMFSQLLSASMDQARLHNAHPAFAQIVKQLSSDEALLLNAMWKLFKLEGRSFRRQFTQDYDEATNSFGTPTYEVDELAVDGLAFPGNMEFYGQHLFALGITAFFDSTSQKPIWDDGSVDNSVIDYNRTQIGVRVFKELRFTDVGLKFMDAVSAA